MPLTFDFPLDKLKTYSGINPRPSNFEVYWNDALQEMREIDPQIELVPAEFQTKNASSYHLYFTGVGGARIHAKFIQPKNPLPAIRLC